jgi:hypothetical protein
MSETLLFHIPDQPNWPDEMNRKAKEEAEHKSFVKGFHSWLYDGKSQADVDFIKSECAVYESEEALRKFLLEAFLRGSEVTWAGVTKSTFNKLIKAKPPTPVLSWQPGAWRGDYRTCVYMSDFGLITLFEDCSPQHGEYLGAYIKQQTQSIPTTPGDNLT